MFPKSFFHRQYFHPRYFPPLVIKVNPPHYSGALVSGVQVDRKVYDMYTVLKAGIALTTFCNIMNHAEASARIAAGVDTSAESHDPNEQRRKDSHRLLINLLILN